MPAPFRQTSRRINVPLLVLLAVLPWVAACSGSPIRPSAPDATSTFLSLTSASGDTVGQGESHQYTVADGVWGVTYSVNKSGKPEIAISVMPPSGNAWWWTLHFTAPAGRTLSVGTYEAAGRWPSEPSNQPGIQVSESGRGCSTVTGRFRITDVVLGPDDTVERFHATFEQHCDGNAAALTGEIAISPNDWR